MSADLQQALERLRAYANHWEALMDSQPAMHEYWANLTPGPEVTFGELRALLAALTPQPMETAPRDQALILVQMAADDWRGPPVRRVTAWWGGDAAGWCSVGHAGLQPICWWPLPPGPKP